MTKEEQKMKAKECYFEKLSLFCKYVKETNAELTNQAIQSIVDFELSMENLEIIDYNEWDILRKEYRQNHMKILFPLGRIIDNEKTLA